MFKQRFFLAHRRKTKGRARERESERYESHKDARCGRGDELLRHIKHLIGTFRLRANEQSYRVIVLCCHCHCGTYTHVYGPSEILMNRTIKFQFRNFYDSLTSRNLRVCAVFERRFFFHLSCRKLFLLRSTLLISLSHNNNIFMFVC